MTQQFYSLLTKLGKAKLTNSQVLGTKLNLTKIQVGNGGDKKGKAVFPTEDDTQLVNQCWEGNINRIYVDDKNENYLVVEAVIPEGIGGWYITEFGIFDAEGDLIAIGGYPKTYKPKLTEGSGSSLYLKVMFEVSNAEVVQLKIDPSIVLATQDFVGEKLLEHVAEENPHSQYLKKVDYEAAQGVRLSQLANLPIYAEIQNEGYKLALTAENNQLVILPDQIILWRGWKTFNTSDYSVQQRTFSYTSNKAYHLRWNPQAGFQLLELSDSNYNPNKLSHDAVDFDSTYDDVLLATLLPDKDKPIIEKVCSDKTKPCFESGWIKISAQAGEGSYNAGEHHLRRPPIRWVAQVKADGKEGNKGNQEILDATFISGSANTVDDEADEYGGVAVAFNSKKYFIWVPSQNNDGKNGSVIMVWDGWGAKPANESNHVFIKNSSIKVIGWY
ncbi:phage tail protein [Spartinivicinus poritis]|uniref:Phage tail protein n=1 Tax=Spartinivicinus poritis TaxID=2994640 RepID=A0ABT5UG67_9GAMM|nr:phage tail protein [Spartinivicinus sp. A2-2]MDE1465380.1 phage tail protein [Spartinivicinus sp. A2-2]